MLRISQISLAKFAFTSAGQFNKSKSYILLSKLARYSQASTGQEMKDETNSSAEKDAIKRCEYCKDYEKLKEKLDEINQDNETLLDKYKRALAEIENTRKRGERLVDESKSFAIQGFCKDLIEVADILNIAVGTLEKEMAVNNSLKNVYEGINMTNDSLLKTFAKHGLIKIDALGQKFDPNLHEAVFEEPAENAKYPPGHVSHVLKTGYSLNKRTVRPSKVAVVKTK